MLRTLSSFSWLSLVGTFVLAEALPAQRHFAVEEQILQEDPGLRQGRSVALSGDRLLSGGGPVFMYRRTAEAWVLEQAFSAPAGSGFLWFGHGVALQGDRAAIGYYVPNSASESLPSVNIYERQAGVWVEQQALQGDPIMSGDIAFFHDIYSMPLVLEGDRLLLGSWLGGDEREGEVLVFEQTDGSWVKEAALRADISDDFASLGRSVAMAGDLIAAGAPQDSTVRSLAGAVVLFERTQGSWSEVRRIDPPVGQVVREFGSGVALTGEAGSRLLVVGARNTQGGGRVFLYRENGDASQWNLEATLAPPNVGSSDDFGWQVAAGPRRVVASSPGDQFNSQIGRGSVHVFLRNSSGTWIYDERVTASDTELQDRYGYNLALEGNQLVVGCPRCDGPTFFNQGASYPIRLLPRPSGAYCESSANSSGFEAEVSVSGSMSVAANDLVLHAGPVPTQFGLFFYGAASTQVPFGSGFLCVQAPRYRLPVAQAALGVLNTPLDISLPPEPAAQITAGSTWRFQAWFRDPADTSGFQLSSAVELTFEL